MPDRVWENAAAVPRFHRLLLIANPAARTVSRSTLAVIEKALSADFKLDVVETARRGHAWEVTREAVDRGDVDLVVVFSGDGTINEALNPLARSDVALGVLPGGATNILVRALGLPTDPVEATAALIDGAVAGRSRTIHLGLAGDRYFAINCGVGLDAAAMRRLDERSPSSKGAYDRIAFRSVLGEVRRYTGREPHLSVRVDGGEPVPSMSVMIGRTDPYTYFRKRALHVTPRASLESGLDVLAVRRFPWRKMPAMALQVFRSARHIERKDVSYFHDASRVEIAAAEPFPIQVDGDVLQDRDSVDVTLERDALRVVV